MTRPDLRSWTLLAVAVLATAVFVRLGVWQMDRLAERRTINAQRAALAAEPAVDLSGATASAAESALWHRVRLTGTWDFENEIVIRGRAALGSPGVHLVTPLKLEDGPAVLVLRGWLPAADGLSADLAAARPPAGSAEAAEEAFVTGRLLPSEASSAIPPRFTRFEDGVHLVLGSLDLEAAARDLEEPVLDAWVLPETAIEAGGRVVPRLVELPPPSDGSHLMYAIQWFGFAVITVGGATVFLVARRRDLAPGSAA